MRRIERPLGPGEGLEDPLDDLRLLYARKHPQRGAAVTAGVDVGNDPGTQRARRCSVGRFIDPQRILLIQFSRIVDQQTFLFHGVTRKHR